MEAIQTSRKRGKKKRKGRKERKVKKERKEKKEEERRKNFIKKSLNHSNSKKTFEVLFPEGCFAK